ncbi:sigma 54-interacting transcriptional regulator [Priestia endophytica]|jgi:sigma-54 dependent transcriptional regulator, acetoin dehydrogenase operon transcriptional activator AcoR|uniref:sigma 54-interacting transcriptional regulator n=1 Tax=Priestia endophytica TaxID=135735 RepID=UPI000DCA5722|nr:sigma 54-interacting transcriptional regulator [Priestia endophytica]KAB2495476.1 PAS domain S-box protein [Priestia endophytica]RAS78065.1 sigma-54-dependent Fis family transcriptional regulator [Priestia endophytica]
MLEFEQNNLHTSFLITSLNQDISEIKNKLTEYSFVVVEGEKYYVISRNERHFLPGDDILVKQWIEQTEWPSSPIYIEEELSLSDLDWNRPLLVSNREGKIKGIITATSWIKTLERRNENLENAFFTLAETINDAVTAVDRDGNVVCWNTAAENTYKIKREDIIGQKIGEHFQSDSIVLHRILNEGRPVRGTYHRPNSDNHVLINASPITSQNQIIGGIATEQDITQMVRLNEELDSSLPLLIQQPKPFSSIVGTNSDLHQALKVAQKVAYAEIPVLLTGESGSGKEMLAQAIHYGGSKRTGPFITLNCSVVPPNFLEFELFGYQERTFTEDEQVTQEGKIQQASNGTLFIEELDKMPLDVQQKFLNYLDDQAFYRVGENEPVTLSENTRVIASTSQNLEEMMQNGEFNESLYYHLTVMNIYIPPLRERKEDIQELVEQFMQEFSAKYKKKAPEISEEVMEVLHTYSWPGNVQELRNVIERFILLCDGGHVSVSYLPHNMREDFSLPEEEKEVEENEEKNEAVLIEEALKKTYGNKSAAANLLGISRGTLYNKLKEYGLN